MAERKILYICEGLQDEPGFLKKLMEKSYPDVPYRIYPYKTTIHTLASKLSEDYEDFDSGDYDIRLIIREMESDPEQKKLLSENFTDIIMGFDFDPHHDNPDFETVKRMLEYFTDSTDMGKLYINYPMMQSFKHFVSLPDPEYKYRISPPYDYKKLVGEESRFTDLSKYQYDTFIQIAVQNLVKVWGILHGTFRMPSYNEYLSMDLSELYQTELEMFWTTDKTHVINTLIFFLIDYNPSTFFSIVSRHPEKYGV